MEKITEEAIRQSIAATLTETFDAMMSMHLESIDTAEQIKLEDNRMVGDHPLWWGSCWRDEFQSKPRLCPSGHGRHAGY